MRLATRPEHDAFMQLICNRDSTNLADLASSESFVHENYTTDCPGYQGPVGIIIWGGSPSWITVFTRGDGVITSSAWEIAVDTARLLEDDPRGEFERVNEKLSRNFDAGARSIGGVFEENDSELVELLDTGSVTMLYCGTRYVLTLNVKEEGK